MNIPRDLPYSSPLSEVMAQMVREKRGLGMKYDTQATILYRMDCLANEVGVPKNTLTKELADRWMCKDPNVSNAYHKAMVDFLKRFAKYMLIHGYDAYLPNVSLPKSHDFKPHIFSNEELKRLFAAADNLHKMTQGNPLKPIIVPVMLRLTYCTGMRISEVCGLKLEDIDFKCGVLHIKNAKFNKERLIPLSDEMLDICREFSKKLHSNSSPDSPYFPHPKGAYSTRSIYCIFREVLLRADISHGGKGNGPRFHDLRHTFAVNNLRKWIARGMNVTAMLPYLAAYMGHTEWADTQVYLRLTSESFPSIIEDMEKFSEGVIPELKEVRLYAD